MSDARPDEPASDKTVVIGGGRSLHAGRSDSATKAEPHPDPRSDDNGLAPGTRIAEFEIIRLIGEGGFGIVYLAYDTLLERHVALKEYMPAAMASRTDATQVRIKSMRHEAAFHIGLKSFVNEARLLARFDHPSLVKVYRFWEDNGTAYMVMPYYAGTTLQDTLKTMDAPPDEAWLHALLAPLLEALAVLHEARCYHRDVAPDNIIQLEGSLHPVLLDFGAARRVISDMSESLTSILKPDYAPIEQHAQSATHRQGPWTDLYSLAAVVHCALTSKPPPDAVSRMMKDEYVPLARRMAGRYSPAFLGAVDRCLALLPDGRPQSTQQFAREAGIKLQPTRIPPVPPLPPVLDKPTPPSKPPDTTGKRRPYRIGVLTACVMLAGVAIATWRPWQRAGINEQQHATTTAARLGKIVRPASASIAENASPALPASTGQSSGQASGISQSTLKPYEPAGEFERIATLGTPGYHVEVTTPLARAIAGHDRLRFTLTSNHAGYVYVFLLDRRNQYIQLFPNGFDSDNRIDADRPLTLPRTSWELVAGAPLGANYFLAIVSSAPRDFSSLGFVHDSAYASLPEDAQRTAAHLRSWDFSPFAGTVQCADPQVDCPRSFAASTFKIEVVNSSK